MEIYIYILFFAGLNKLRCFNQPTQPSRKTNTKVAEMIFVTSTRCVESKGLISKAKVQKGELSYPFQRVKRSKHRDHLPEIHGGGASNIELSNLDWVNYDGLPDATGIP